jgi:hypothetical protein
MAEQPKRPQPASSPRNEFEQQAAAARTSLAGEFWYFVKNNKKWWLLPILVCIGLVGALVLLASSGAAPFIYTLF